MGEQLDLFGRPLSGTWRRQESRCRDHGERSRSTCPALKRSRESSAEKTCYVACSLCCSLFFRPSRSIDVSSEYVALGIRIIDHARDAVYFSESALNEIDDARYSLTQESSAGLTVKFLTLYRQKTTSQDRPGSADIVDLALKRARRPGRKTVRDLHAAASPGTVFDIEVTDLRVGVMPFLYFGDYGEFLEGAGQVRVFWAQALVPPRWRGGKSSRELILLGSLNKVTNEPWSGTGESSLKIGFSYPSDPSVLSRLVSAELQLDSDPSVRKHIEDVEKCEEHGTGCYAEFASQQTARARESLCWDEEHITHWERRPPLRRARVVGITTDICDESEEGSAGSTLLARPVLIRDLSLWQSDRP